MCIYFQAEFVWAEHTRDFSSMDVAKEQKKKPNLDIVKAEDEKKELGVSVKKKQVTQFAQKISPSDIQHRKPYIKREKNSNKYGMKEYTASRMIDFNIFSLLDHVDNENQSTSKEVVDQENDINHSEMESSKENTLKRKEIGKKKI